MDIINEMLDDKIYNTVFEKLKAEQIEELTQLQKKIDRYKFIVKNEELFVPLSKESFKSCAFGDEEWECSFNSNGLIHHIIDHMPPKLDEKSQFAHIFLQFFYYTKDVIFCDEENEVSHLNGWLKTLGNLIASTFNFYLSHHEMTLTEVKEFIHIIYNSCMHCAGNTEEYEDERHERITRLYPNSQRKFETSSMIYNEYKSAIENLFYYPISAEKVLSLIDFDRLSLSRSDFTIEHDTKMQCYRLHNAKDDIHVEAKNVNLLEYELAKWKNSLYLQFYNQKEPDEIFQEKEDEQYWWKQRKLFEKIFADILSTEE